MFVPATRLNALGAIGVLLLLGGFDSSISNCERQPRVILRDKTSWRILKRGEFNPRGVLTLLGTVCILVRSAICEVVPCQYVRR